ncbi:MAG: RNA-binding S4 domain-containing protein [Clostridia bacterium]|nr:RNA-binding S4 domain-containing protein [Clostridia bacterium]
MEKVAINTQTIKLDQFLKWAEIVGSGGEAKVMIQNGHVRVNSQLATQRGKMLVKGDIVKVGDKQYQLD